MKDQEPPKKKARTVAESDPTTSAALKFLQGNKDILVNEILPFVGPGNFLSVAAIGAKKHYETYFASLTKPPQVWDQTLGLLNHGNFRPATASDTFYSSVFGSVAFASYWDKSTKGNQEIRLRTHRVCTLAAKYGNAKVLEWAHKNRFPWSEHTCAVAAKAGQLSCLPLGWAHGRH